MKEEIKGFNELKKPLLNKNFSFTGISHCAGIIQLSS